MEFDALVEPLFWGRNRYTVVRLPDELVVEAARAGTRRVAGDIDGVPVNVAITKAPVVDGAFLYAGAALLRRLGVDVGEPVTCRLEPADPDDVPVPDDVAEALEDAGRRDAWEALTPATRRRRLVPVDAARSAPTRARRVAELVAGLG